MSVSLPDSFPCLFPVFMTYFPNHSNALSRADRISSNLRLFVLRSFSRFARFQRIAGSSESPGMPKTSASATRAVNAIMRARSSGVSTERMSATSRSNVVTCFIVGEWNVARPGELRGERLGLVEPMSRDDFIEWPVVPKCIREEPVLDLRHRPATLEELRDVEKIARMLPVKRRAELPAIEFRA